MLALPHAAQCAWATYWCLLLPVSLDSLIGNQRDYHYHKPHGQSLATSNCQQNDLRTTEVRDLIPRPKRTWSGSGVRIWSPDLYPG